MCNAGTDRTLYLPCLSNTLPALSVRLSHSCVSLSVAPVNHCQSLPFQSHVTLDPVSCIPLVSPFVLLWCAAPCLVHHTCCGVVHHVWCTTHAPARAWYGRVGGACYGSLLQLLSCCISQGWWCMVCEHTTCWHTMHHHICHSIWQHTTCWCCLLCHPPTTLPAML